MRPYGTPLVAKCTYPPQHRPGESRPCATARTGPGKWFNTLISLHWLNKKGLAKATNPERRGTPENDVNNRPYSSRPYFLSLRQRETRSIPRIFAAMVRLPAASASTHWM